MKKWIVLSFWTGTLHSEDPDNLKMELKLYRQHVTILKHL